MSGRVVVGYLRRLFMVLAIAVQLVTLAYVMVVMGQSQPFDPNRSIVNSTDARATYYLAAVSLSLMLILGVILWVERRGPPRRRQPGNEPAPTQLTTADESER